MQRHTDTPASVCRMLWLPAGRISRVWQLPCDAVTGPGGVPQFLFH